MNNIDVAYLAYLTSLYRGFNYGSLQELRVSKAQRLARQAEDPEVPGSSPTDSRLNFQSCSRYQANQLGSKAAPESTFKSQTLAEYQILDCMLLYFYKPPDEHE